MKQLTTIAKLLEVRDSMKAVHREDWSEHMETYGAIIRALMAKSGVHNHVAAAITLSQDATNEGHPMIALLFLAVGVELSELEVPASNGQFAPCQGCPNALLCGDIAECGAEIHREA